MKANIDDIKMELWLRHRNNGEILWQTKDGTLIDIKNLSDTHIKNIFNRAKIINKINFEKSELQDMLDIDEILNDDLDIGE